MKVDEHLQIRLGDWERQGLLREDTGPRNPELWDVSSNDYLGYARSPVSRETLEALSGISAGAGASRLVHGTCEQHLDLEARLAEWVGLPTALTVSSGYAANVGLLAALGHPGDLIVSDALNHASIIDGCRLGRARVAVVPHLDLEAVDRALEEPAQAKWVVTESYFSMDGESPNLRALRAICDQHEAGLVVDEAHALGVFGPEGAGLCRAAGVLPDALVGAFGKAFGAQGGFVAGSPRLRQYLWNRARSVVFSTGISPLLAALVSERLACVRGDDAGRLRLRRASERLAERLLSAGVPLPPDRCGPIFPIVFGDPHRAVRAAAELRDAGFLAQAIRPPTVPPGTSRVRISLHAGLSDDVIERLATAVVAAYGAERHRATGSE